MKKFLLSVLMTGATIYGFAQVQENTCGTDEVYRQMVEQDPAILQRQQLFEQQARKIADEPTRKAGQVRIIPVVFHIFHRAGSENISDVQINDEVRILNENYRRMNANAANTRPIFLGVAADMEIEFRLARKDPHGNCTNGIVRVYEEETENGTNNIKIKSVWPTDRYLNVWVVNNIVNYASNLPGIAGYAQFPWSGSYNTDGVIILSSQIGSIGSSNPNNASTVTHEVGHWLGLYHTFQDSCLGGDKVDDTPPAASIRNGILSCDYNRNTCATDHPDLPDQIENYMDYTVGTCQNMFSMGQKARVEATLSNWRSFMWTMQNLIATGTDVPNQTANCAPIAEFFTIDNQFSLNPYACAGGAPISFRDNSYNYSGTITRQWIFEGGSPATSTQLNPSVTYATPGKYDVTLIVSNANGTDTIVKEDYIEVTAAQAPISGPYTQDFEFPVFPTDGWYTNSTTYIDYDIYNVGEGAVFPGNGRTLRAVNGSGVAGSRFDLYSPSINLAAMTNPVLSFYYAFTTRSGSNDGFRVYYSVDCGQNWNQLWARAGSALNTTGTSTTPATNLPFVPSDKSKWKQVVIPIPGTITTVQRNNMRFRFQFISNGGHNFYLDAINVGFPSAIEDAFYGMDENFNIYPNPATGKANVSINLFNESDITVKVFDIMGREVATLANGKFQGGVQEFTFDAAGNNAASGMYFVKLAVNGSVITKKLVIE